MIRVIKNSSKNSKFRKNPIYISDVDRLDYYFDLYQQMNQLDNTVVSIHSNTGIILGILFPLESKIPHEATEKTLIKATYIVKTNFYKAIKPNRDDLGLFFKDESLAHELFWNEHDEFKKENLEKTINFSFVLGNVDKIDLKNSKIYVRKLKQFKGKI